MSFVPLDLADHIGIMFHVNVQFVGSKDRSCEVCKKHRLSWFPATSLMTWC